MWVGHTLDLRGREPSLLHFSAGEQTICAPSLVRRGATTPLGLVTHELHHAEGSF